MASLGFYQWRARAVMIGMQLSRLLGRFWSSIMGFE